MSTAKRRLAKLWVSIFAIMFIVLLLQMIAGKYADKMQEVWSWWFPTIVPTLALIISVYVEDVRGKSVEIPSVDKFFFSVTFALSSVYLVAVIIIIAASALPSVAPIKLMASSSLFLVPLQGVVIAALGAFFIRKAA